MFEILNTINNANDIKDIDSNRYNELAKEIRRFLVGKISKTGGHLASNLGVVELTMALHLCLQLPEDKIIWDVGHQSYTHKLLTGRRDMFDSLRSFQGMSGFPKRNESVCDTFDTGHSSTSISAALGFAKARDLKKQENTVVAVIGDGALSGGMAYEALNNAARLKSNMIIILNDNEMSISKNVGGMARYLGSLRTGEAYIGLKAWIEKLFGIIPNVGNIIIDRLKKSKDSIKYLLLPGVLFEEMGVTYIGPIDGHNIELIMESINNAKRMKKAVLIHVITKKGKGYPFAERNPSKFHGIEPFNVRTGEPFISGNNKSYTEVFSEELVNVAESDDKVVAITAAMAYGTGLNEFAKRYPERLFDVGIAEEHAVTFGAGLAAEGFKPVVAIYSSFLQRSYDQIIHDVCIQKLPVIFAIDRAGITGCDGETHQGVFDISFLTCIPNLTVIAPKNDKELGKLLQFAVDYNGPIALRYPRGEAYTGLKEYNEPIVHGKSEVIYKEKDIALLAVGSMVETAVKVYNILKDGKYNNVTLINVRFIKPFDEKLIIELSKNHNLIVTLEENVINGSFGQMIAGFMYANELNHVKLLNIAVPDEFIEHGETNILKENIGLSASRIVDKIITNYNME